MVVIKYTFFVCFILLDDKKNILAEGLSGEYVKNDNFEIVISESLKSFTDLFLNKKIVKPNKDFGQLSDINGAFKNVI